MPSAAEISGPSEAKCCEPGPGALCWGRVDGEGVRQGPGTSLRPQQSPAQRGKTDYGSEMWAEKHKLEIWSALGKGQGVWCDEDTLRFCR